MTARNVIRVFAALAVVALATACLWGPPRRPSKYLVPDGFVGWVRIDFRVSDAPPTPIDSGFYVFEIPDDGWVRTSSDIEYGVATDEYYYVSPQGLRPLRMTGWGEGGTIWGQFNGKSESFSKSGGDGPATSPSTATYELFFVGTEDDFHRLPEPRRASDGTEIPGRL